MFYVIDPVNGETRERTNQPNIDGKKRGRTNKLTVDDEKR